MNTPESEITNHGFDRMIQRLGVPKRSVHRLAEKALIEGHRPIEYVGAFNKFLGYLGARYHTTPVVYNQHIYAFSGNVLVTVYPVPQQFRNHKPKVAK